jgi:hypothetical protein
VVKDKLSTNQLEVTLLTKATPKIVNLSTQRVQISHGGAVLIIQMIHMQLNGTVDVTETFGLDQKMTHSEIKSQTSKLFASGSMSLNLWSMKLSTMIQTSLHGGNGPSATTQELTAVVILG